MKVDDKFNKTFQWFNKVNMLSDSVKSGAMVQTYFHPMTSFPD